ncbi:hypothetical protein BC830DRAFT_1134838 [Chytriomyces sp. MP71]|nr:hypothetical protein BC830DRAFT_1134838 [Chytriomyces sp. MP71]
MSSGSSTSPALGDLAPPYKSLAKSKRGRKPAASDAETRRQQTVRNAQRAFQDRKRMYVMNLEQRVDELTRELARLTAAADKEDRKNLLVQNTIPNEAIISSLVVESGTGTFQECPTCQASKIQVQFYQNQVAALDRRLASYTSPAELLRTHHLLPRGLPPQPSSVSSTPSISNGGTTMDEWTDIVIPVTQLSKSATELYGPVSTNFLKVIVQNSILPLKDDKYVDICLESLEACARSKDKMEIARYLARIYQCWYHAMDLCRSESDRRVLFELDEIFHALYRKHMDVIYSVARELSGEISQGELDRFVRPPDWDYWKCRFDAIPCLSEDGFVDKLLFALCEVCVRMHPDSTVLTTQVSKYMHQRGSFLGLHFWLVMGRTCANEATTARCSWQLSKNGQTITSKVLTHP